MERLNLAKAEESEAVRLAAEQTNLLVEDISAHIQDLVLTLVVQASYIHHLKEEVLRRI